MEWTIWLGKKNVLSADHWCKAHAIILTSKAIAITHFPYSSLGSRVSWWITNKKKHCINPGNPGNPWRNVPPFSNALFKKPAPRNTVSDFMTFNRCPAFQVTMMCCSAGLSLLPTPLGVLQKRCRCVANVFNVFFVLNPLYIFLTCLNQKFDHWILEATI